MYSRKVKYLDEIKAHAEECAPNEACGFLCADDRGNTIVYRCENKARNKRNRFVVDPADYVKASKLGHIVFFYHSHADEFPKPEIDRFSKEDLDISEELCIPALLYVIPQGNWHFHTPSTYKPVPLLRRAFVWGVWDCITLIRDYFLVKKRRIYIENKLPIKDGVVVFDWQSSVKLDCMYEVPLSEMREDDVLMFKFANVELPHFAVYLGGNEFMHQSYGGMSQISTMDEKYASSIFKVFRVK